MTDDLISRADAIAEFNCCEYTPDGGIDANYVIDFLEQMPSAQPKQGEWIDTTNGAHYKCSLCGCRASYFCIDTNRAIEWLSDYCPNCGARMKGADNEND